MGTGYFRTNLKFAEKIRTIISMVLRILSFNFRTFQFPLHCALVSVRRADKKVLPATLPLTDQLLLRSRRTELNFYGQGGNSFHHTLRYGHIGHTPNANPSRLPHELRTHDVEIPNSLCPKITIHTQIYISFL